LANQNHCDSYLERLDAAATTCVALEEDDPLTDLKRAGKVYFPELQREIEAYSIAFLEQKEAISGFSHRYTSVISAIQTWTGDREGLEALHENRNVVVKVHKEHLASISPRFLACSDQLRTAAGNLLRDIVGMAEADRLSTSSRPSDPSSTVRT
jgi:hypothetical protein